MVKESLKMLGELVAALERTRAGHDPAHAASGSALEAIEKAVVATRDYIQDEMLHLDGSRQSARFSALARLWKQATATVTALELEGAEKAALRGGGWTRKAPWSKLDKQGGFVLLQGIVDHCAWLLSVLPPGPGR